MMHLLWHEAGGPRKDVLAVTLGSWRIPLGLLPALTVFIWLADARNIFKIIFTISTAFILFSRAPSEESAIFIRGVGFQQVQGTSRYQPLLEDEEIAELFINETITQTDVCFYPCLSTRKGSDLVPFFRSHRPNLLLSAAILQQGAEIWGRKCAPL